MNLGSKLDSEKTDEMIKAADPKGEGVVDVEEFADYLCPPKK